MKTTIKATQLKTLVAQSELAREKAVGGLRKVAAEKIWPAMYSPVNWENGSVTATMFPLKILASWAATFPKGEKVRLEVGASQVKATVGKSEITLLGAVNLTVAPDWPISVDCHGRAAKVVQATVKELRQAKKAAIEERERKERTADWIRGIRNDWTIQKTIREIVQHIKELKEERIAINDEMQAEGERAA